MKSQSMMLLTKTHRFIARMVIAFALLLNNAMATDPPALNDISSYLVCAGEGQSFVLPRVCDVAYGAHGKFVFKAAQVGTVVFNNATFGDPIPGVGKSGYYRFAAGFPVSTVTTTGTGLTGDYYDNIFVKGFPQRRVDATVNFPWNGAVPMPGIPQTNFSARWSGQIQARFDGDVTLITTSDDGVKVWINGQLLVNDWVAHGNKENWCTFASVAGQKHDLRIEYYQGGGGSFMRLEWQSANEPRTVVPATCLYPVGADTPLVLPTYVPGTGTGLTGDYRHTADSIGSRLRRLDPIINFPWGGGSPDPSISADNFTVRWSGQIQTRFDGDCTLSTISDDGVRLFIDGKLLINDWALHGDKENFCTFPSLAGQKHDIRIEYFESGGGAAMYLKWQSVNEGYTLVPTSCLYPYNLATVIPTASAVSPAFFEGVYGVTLPVINTGVLSDLGESQFYANVPLLATGATGTTPVTLTEGSKTSSGSITWTPTAVTEGPALVIRKGDSLLFAFPTDGSATITNYSGAFLPPVAVTSGQLLPVLFSKAGEFKVLARDSNGIEVGSRTVTVVSVDLPPSILGEVQFTRALNLSVSPANAPVTFTGNNQLTVTTTAIADGLAKLALTPLTRGTPRLLARINGANGPLVCEKEIGEFTIDSAALKSSVINAQTDIGTASLVMRPYIPGEEFTFTMFAHGATFKGGATKIIVNTTGGASSNGEPPFVQKFDSVTKETIGIFRFDLEVPPTESKYCFSVERKQSEPVVVSGAMLHGSSSPFGLQASMPLAGLSLMMGLSPGPGTNGPTTNVNGDACHVLAYASLIFTQADDYSEDEINKTSNPETWKSRQWNLITSDYCVKGTEGDGNCNAVSYKLTVSDAPPFSGPLDNRIAALFGASSRQSSCKTCSGTCGPVSATMDSGTIPGKYTTSISVCGTSSSTGSGDSLGDSVGGVFYVSKLDAHGFGSETRTKFPDYAETLPKRPGTYLNPVIQMNSGGVGDVNGCSLYGVECDSKNKWFLKAIAKTPEGTNDPGVRYVWQNVGPASGSTSESIEVTLPPGRYNPRLEVWADLGDGDELVGFAEIHSIVVDRVYSSNVGSVQPVQKTFGTKAAVTNTCDVQADVKFTASGSGDTRARVSLDGYPQNEYWVGETDETDLYQVQTVNANESKTIYLQGYKKPSQAGTEDQLTLEISGQAMLEACSGSPCVELFEGTPVSVQWQVADTEKFDGFQISLIGRDRRTGVTYGHGLVTQRHQSAPIVEITSASGYYYEKTLSITISGTIRDYTSEVAPNESSMIQSYKIFVNNTLVKTVNGLPAQGSGSEVPIWVPRPFDITFNESLSVHTEGDDLIGIRVETSENAIGKIGAARVGFAVDLIPTMTAGETFGFTTAIGVPQATTTKLTWIESEEEGELALWTVEFNTDTPQAATYQLTKDEEIANAYFVDVGQAPNPVTRVWFEILDELLLSDGIVNSFTSRVSFQHIDPTLGAIGGIWDKHFSRIWTETSATSHQFSAQDGFLISPSNVVVVPPEDGSEPETAHSFYATTVGPHTPPNGQRFGFAPVIPAIEGLHGEPDSLRLRIKGQEHELEMREIGNDSYFVPMSALGRPRVLAPAEYKTGSAANELSLGTGAFAIELVDNQTGAEAGTLDGEEEEGEEEERTPAPTPPIPKSDYTLDQIKPWLTCLYGAEGEELLSLYTARVGNQIIFGDYSTNSSLSGTDGALIIKLEEDDEEKTDTEPGWSQPQCAMALYSRLMQAVPRQYSRVIVRGEAQDAPSQAQNIVRQRLMNTAYSGVGDAIKEEAAPILEAYKMGIEIAMDFNPAGAFIITLNSALEGDKIAALQLLRKCYKGPEFTREIKIKVPGKSPVAFSREIAQAIADCPIKHIVYSNYRRLYNYYYESGATNEQMKMLLDAGYIPNSAYDNRDVLRGRLIAANKTPKEEWTKNMAQHDAPCKFQTYFMSVGVDINDAEWGRFVDGRTFPNKKNPHLSWSRKFNTEWETFWATKPLNDFTREEVETKTRELAADPRFPSE